MTVAAAVLSVLLGLAMIASGAATITGQEKVVENLAKADTPEEWYGWLGALKIAGGVGLLVGLWIPAIGIAAAVGLALYFAGAIAFHVRAKDPGWAPPAAIMVASVAVAVLRSLTL